MQAIRDGKPNYNIYANKIDVHSPVSAKESKNNAFSRRDGVGLGKDALRRYGAQNNSKVSGTK